jgi:Peptidase family M48
VTSIKRSFEPTPTTTTNYLMDHLAGSKFLLRTSFVALALLSIGIFFQLSWLGSLREAFVFVCAIGFLTCIALIVQHVFYLDPVSTRVRTADFEDALAHARLAQVVSLVKVYAPRLGLNEQHVSIRFCNSGAYALTIPLVRRHVIGISRALLARLSDASLQIIIAHEVAHCSRRSPAISDDQRLQEEIRADRLALFLTGMAASDWQIAIEESALAEMRNLDWLAGSIAARRDALALHTALINASQSS